MINHNEVLDFVLNGTMSVDYGGKQWVNNYIEGDVFQVWEVLSTKKTKYPLIWLQSGYTVLESGLKGNSKQSFNANIYLITKGDMHDFNKKRYADTYKFILYPLLEKLKATVNKSKGVQFANDYEFITFPFNNQDGLNDKSNKSRPQTSTLYDIWDAIYLNIDVTINGDCYPEFKIN